MKEIARKALGLLTALLVTVGAYAPTMVAAAVEIEHGAAITPNVGISTGTVVHFAGYEWYAIGYEGTGAYSDTGLTLLAKNNDFGSSPFRGSSSGSTSRYGEGFWEFWFDDNPDGAAWVDPHEYRGSTLQLKMAEIARDIEAASAREYGLINLRTLTASDEIVYPIKGGDVENQALWALSYDEWAAIRDNTVRDVGNFWWLRTPGWNEGVNALIALNSTSSISISALYVVRPALNMDISSVLFTSSAIPGSGKAQAVVGGGLTPAEPVGQNVKFTVLDPGMPTPNVTLADEGTSTLQFDFTGAATGTGHYLSCVIEQGDEVKYYAKLAASAGGAFGIDTTGLDGSYILRVFNEQVNGDDYTDFASETYDIPFTVAGGAAVVDPSPAFAINPTSATYIEGEAATPLAVEKTMSGSSTLTYQWYENNTDSNTGGTPIAGAETDTYTPPADTVGTTYYYAVVTGTVAGKTASTPSNTARIDVLELFDAETPTISAQPAATTTCYVDAAAVELAARASVTDGGTLTYQWYTADDTSHTNPQAIAGAQSATLAPPTGAAGTYYYVEITNENTSATGNQTASINSNVATVNVLAHSLTLGALAPTDLSATVGRPYNLTFGYSYTDTKALDFALTGTLPAGLTFNPANHTLSGTPAEGTERDYPLTLTVAEQNGSLAANQAFTLTVQAAQAPPPAAALALATPEGATIAVGSSYQQQLTATYTNGTSALVYSANGLPAGISINPATGLINGTPTTEGWHEVTVTVAEQGGSLQATARFTITVVAAPVDPEPEPKPEPEPEPKPEITFSGLPANNTLRVGGSITLTPSEDGQTGSTGWKWDSEYFSATFNSPATFTALKAGTSTITYTAPDGRSVSVAFTVEAAPATPTESPIAKTGDGSMMWLYAVLAAAAAALAGGLVWYKRRKCKR